MKKRSSASRGSPTLVTLSLIAAVVSAVAFIFVLSGFNQGVLFAPETAGVNVSLQSTIAINFTNRNIDWGTVALLPGQNGILNSEGTATGVDTGLPGFVQVSDGFIVENLGTEVALNLRTNNDAATFIPFTGSRYQYKVRPCAAVDCSASNSDTADGDVSGSPSCLPGADVTLGVYKDVVTGAPGDEICATFYPESNRDEIRIDVEIEIPSGASGDLEDIFTLTAS